MKNLFVTFLTLVISVSLFAKRDPVLMEINGNPVTKSEFEYIYNKNNSNNVLDKKTLEEYVDLFVNFKLKVEEAKVQGVDTTEAFISELQGYRDQLIKPYFIDSEAEEAVIKEAYDRMKEDVEVSHILLRLDQNAASEDTIKVWERVQNIVSRLKVEDFETVAKEVSEDESAIDNGGYVGWITSFRTIYPFESTAYNTPVGSISEPVRTDFGYHIIKVHNRRMSPGEVLTSHIMMFTAKDEYEMNERAKQQIDSLYLLIQGGVDFGELAYKHSEDKASAQRNGELPWFGTGRMVADFEQAAFALENKGDISKPIQSPYGWHIIKLLDTKPIPSYEDKKAEIERMIKRDERAYAGRNAFINKLKKDYKLKFKKNNHLSDFYELLNGRSLADSSFQADAQHFSLNKQMFKFAKKKYRQDQFLAYLLKNTSTVKVSDKDIIDDKYASFIEKELLDYENEQLEKKYDDFRLLMQEYHDGILLFEVSNEEVWEKASKDKEGLAEFFQKNKENYQVWDKPRFKGRVIYSKTKEFSEQAQMILATQQPLDSIDKELRLLNDSVMNIKVDKGLFLEGENKHVDNQIFKIIKDITEKDEQFPYTIVYGRLIDQPEEYADVRGLVTADYQEYLEKKWVDYLRNKYPVKINQRVLRKVQKN